MRKLIKRLGIMRAIVVLSLLLTLIVACISAGFITLLYGQLELLPFYIVLGHISLIAPIIFYYFVTLVYHLNESEEKLHALAIRDDLTGAYNRRYFLEQAEKEFEKCRRYNQPFSIVALDIDNFKTINDTYGHFAGDAVLKKMTETCQRILRSTDLFARFGGEEFVFLILESARCDVQQFSERIRGILEKLVVEHDGYQLNFTVSLGVKTVDMRSETLETLLSAADAALYEAKRRGKNGVVIAGRHEVV